VPPQRRERREAPLHGAVRVKNSYLRALFYRLKARRGAMKAIVAVAASILRSATTCSFAANRTATSAPPTSISAIALEPQAA
jgi:hypothetical protein